MATLPPTISFIAVTPTTISIGITPPTDPAYDHTLVYVYDYLTNQQVYASAPVMGLSHTVTGLTRGRSYIVVAIAVDTGAENSIPCEKLVVTTTNTASSFGEPKLIITDVVQESRTKVRVEYRLEDTQQIFGELVQAYYSFNGAFSDQVIMKEAFTDSRHEGRFGLEFLPDAFIVDPQHFFIWDISEIPKNTVHQYTIRLQGKSGALYSVAVEDTIDIDTTEDENIPVPAVIEDGDLLVTIPVFRNQAAVTGATVTVTEIRDDADVDQLGAPVVLPELGTTGVYQDTINLPVADFPAGRYRMFFTVVKAPDLSLTGSKVVLVVEQDYDAAAQLNGAETCLVYGKVVDQMGRPLVGQTVRASYVKEASRYDRVGTTIIEVETDAYGFFALHLLRNTHAVLEIPAMQYASRITVPDEYTAQFNSIQDNQPSTLQRGPYGHLVLPDYYPFP